MACVTPWPLPRGLDLLMDREQKDWDTISAAIPAWHPRAEADPAVVDPPKDDPAPPADPPEDDPDDRVRRDDDWQTKSRKNETRAKKAEREAAELRDRLAKIEGESKSEHEKALEQARKEARDEALSEAEKDRRHDRLEVASTRLAARGFAVGDGDDAQTLRFADPDDALVYIERAIRSGDVDEADIFDDDGKVQADALQTALADILNNKPHLRASEDRGKPKGNPDTRRGTSADKELEAMTPEDHAKRKYGASK